MLTVTAASLMIRYSREITSYLRMLTDFSGCTVRCESEPGRACSEEKYNYVTILFCITTVIVYSTLLPQIMVSLI